MYCAWSLLDNFEWNQGYSIQFGLFHVDFEDPARPRVPYTSAKEYAKVIRNNGLEGDICRKDGSAMSLGEEDMAFGKEICSGDPRTTSRGLGNHLALPRDL